MVDHSFHTIPSGGIQYYLHGRRKKGGSIGTCPVWEGVAKQCFCPHVLWQTIFRRKRLDLKPNYIFCLSVLNAFGSFQEVCLPIFQSSPNVSPNSQHTFRSSPMPLILHQAIVKAISTPFIRWGLSVLYNVQQWCSTSYMRESEFYSFGKKNLHDLITSLNGRIGPIKLV